uniref:THAP-type domain-containing protein n=1 Tax=Maylandia zebra TaxID=106582 RepID=A0A3P9BUN4_9CICH
MVRTCCAVGCKVRSHDRQGNKVENGLSFHSFPTWKQHEAAHVSDVTKRRRLVWIAAVRPADIQFSFISKYLLVCSRHFHSGNNILLKHILNLKMQFNQPQLIPIVDEPLHRCYSFNSITKGDNC